MDFFLEHHSEENILDDIKKDRVFLCLDTLQNAIGTITIKDNEIVVFLLCLHIKVKDLVQKYLILLKE